jgi:hypothetical protein
VVNFFQHIAFEKSHFLWLTNLGGGLCVALWPYQKSLTDVRMISGEGPCTAHGVYPSPVFLF